MVKSDAAIRKSNVVAVVDGDPAVRNSLKFSLETEGWKVCVYARAQELLDTVDAHLLHCIVIEYRLQDMMGLDLVDQLRSRNFGIPAILLASHPNRQIRQQAAQRGVTIVEKPLVGNLLTERLRELIA